MYYDTARPNTGNFADTSQIVYVSIQVISEHYSNCNAVQHEINYLC